MGYGEPGLFIYKVTQTGKNNKVFRTDTLGLFCTALSVPWLRGQTVMQWEFLSKDKNGDMIIPKDMYNNAYTGISVDDTELFIHPAREQFRILQFCPYPYFQSNKKTGETWTWDFAIGDFWSAPPEYPITGVDTFHITYSFTDTALLDTKFGKLFCHKVVGTSLSKYGKSTTEYFLNNEFCIVAFNISAVNHRSFQFELIEKRQGLEAIRFNNDLIRIIDQAEEEKQKRSAEKAMQYIGIDTINK